MKDNQDVSNTTKIYNKNFQLLSSMPSQKLIVDKNNKKLYIDDRWFQCVRRKYNGDSRYDIIQPIQKTFKNATFSFEKKLKCLQYLQKVFMEIYPYYNKLHILLRDLEKEYKKKILTLEIPSKYIKSIFDFVVLVPKAFDNLSSELNQHKKDFIFYTYMAPPSSNPNLDTLVFGQNTKYSQTLKKLGLVKYLDISKIIPTLSDNIYDIRYNGLRSKTFFSFKIQDGKFIPFYSD